ncbi:LPXTG cell wall anchor domain-containing protein [Larkinella terrae]|uniref:LPXTG cell wall anchor domain-containing protein n=1 Tax=Larkinella terrae TaxID=2025311 RepID=A0A7K0ETF1_9BACT|nr:LPXTG cell wall anchor domain-containing protein [Larkinella terrae]MRS64811.1 LPXTG cell wall anchor domain-containing protein [Larkinella terrae]
MKKLLFILLLFPSLAFGAKITTASGYTLDCPGMTVDAVQEYIGLHPNGILCCGIGEKKKCVGIAQIDHIVAISPDGNIGDEPDTGPRIDPGIGIFAGLLLIALAIYFGRKRGLA